MKQSKPKDKTLEGWVRLLEDINGGGTRGMSAAKQISLEKKALKKIDGRSLRKTGRTQQFNARVKASTKREIQHIAKSQGWLIGEAIEHAVAALVEKLDSEKPS